MTASPRRITPASRIVRPAASPDDFAEEKSEERAAISAAAFIAKRLGGRSPTTSAQRIDEITADSAFRIADVVTVLEADPALAARILQLVNSSGYAMRTPCRSVQQAVLVLGASKLRAVARTAGVLHLFDTESTAAYRVREHSTIVGTLARQIAPVCGLPPEEMFTCGALHDLGKLLLIEAEEQEYTELLETAGRSFDGIFAHERARLGFDHAVLAGYMLRMWRIPDPVPRVIAWHHHPPRAEREGHEIAARVHLLRLADRLSYALFDTADRDELAARLEVDESVAYLGLSRAWCHDELPTLQQLARGVRTSLAEVLPAATPSSPAREPAAPLEPARETGITVDARPDAPPPRLGVPLGVGAATALLAAGGVATEAALTHGLLAIAGASGLAAIGSALGLSWVLWSRAHRAAPPGSVLAQPDAVAPKPPPGAIETPYLRITTDPITGELSGVVRRGALRGRTLAELTLTWLRELHTECVQLDPPGAVALAGYIDRLHGDAWRAPPPSTHVLSRDEALRVLGLTEGASRDDVRATYRRLVLKLHPDHGGSSYLAARINEAKDRLLGR